MATTRRGFLAATAAAGLARSAPQSQPGSLPAPRTAPPVCLYSQVVVKIEYADLGPILKGLGLDGCDLSVQAGGHVKPGMASLDLTRAVESLRGSGIDVPVITTSLTSPQDPDVREVLGIAGLIKVQFFRPGHWKYGSGDVMTRLAAVRRDVALLSALGRAAGVTAALHNEPGDSVGAAIWDTDAMLRGLDPQSVGYDFDIAAAAAQSGPEGWPVALRLALPRLKMVTVADCYWEKTGGAWKIAPCPLGEGMVDWPRFTGMLAQANFAGPVSLHVDYRPADEVSAIQRDLEFLRKQIAAAYRTAA